MKDYQPIVKNLKNMALRNRNFLSTEKVKMPLLNAEKMVEYEPGITSALHSPLSPKSPVRKMFYSKYIDDNVSVKESVGSNKVRNMVFANKEERRAEKEVCKFILTKVLNQSNLTKITGITTMNDIKKEAEM